MLSPNYRERKIFTHTGWRLIDGKYVYLAGTAKDGADYEVDLGSELSRYKLPTAGDSVEVMRTSLKLLDLAPPRITAPLWAACYRAPTFSAFPQDLSAWIEGRTGSMKSTLAALFLCHFGEFDRVHVPGSWSSTAKSIGAADLLAQGQLVCHRRLRADSVRS